MHAILPGDGACPPDVARNHDAFFAGGDALAPPMVMGRAHHRRLFPHRIGAGHRSQRTMARHAPRRRTPHRNPPAHSKVAKPLIAQEKATAAPVMAKLA
ncbi:hypothetical protein CAL12_07050 [Bordetella genomosp. 8]|uniref:Uncharacterized protein n=1 Tax=Bordetella genomosp. 8 TaxID=1416806 RepID=A0A1W6YHP1_9BORD|nr:hypothetical protein CAL12_07050 [Bordetella genomosp. 8]